MAFRVVGAPLVAFLCTVLLQSLKASSVCETYNRLETRVQCGTDGYLLSYGRKYCQRFTNTSWSQFSPAGKEWVSCTASCLADFLTRYLSLHNWTASCDQIQEAAFSSHTRCYTSCGFCQTCLSIRDKVALLGIFDMTDFLSGQTLLQARTMLLACWEEHSIPCIL